MNAMPLKLVKLPDVIAFSNKCRSSIFADIKKGTFPAPVRIGLRATAWRVSDLEAWANGLMTTNASSNTTSNTRKEA
jgi:prophage regulatory protein